MSRAAFIVVACAAASARADDLAGLEHRGEQLAKEGHFSDAIDAFKQADKLVARASHACLIALAYTRRELWPQAEIFFATCRQRASESDPAPDWLPIAEKTLAEHLANASVAPVEIRIEPANPSVRLAVSSFAHDETFAPRTIHLAFGDHVITATADGYEPVQQPVVVASKELQHVTIRLSRRVKKPGKTAWIVMGAGAAILVAGGIYHAAELAPARDQLATDGDPAMPKPLDYKAASHDFDVRQKITIGLYAAGAATVITGLVLRQTVFREHPVYVAPTAGGVAAGMSWSWR